MKLENEKCLEKVIKKSLSVKTQDRDKIKLPIKEYHRKGEKANVRY